jgi:hypothetical protein
MAEIITGRPKCDTPWRPPTCATRKATGARCLTCQPRCAGRCDRPLPGCRIAAHARLRSLSRDSRKLGPSGRLNHPSQRAAAIGPALNAWQAPTSWIGGRGRSGPRSLRGEQRQSKPSLTVARTRSHSTQIRCAAGGSDVAPRLLPARGCARGSSLPSARDAPPTAVDASTAAASCGSQSSR